MASLLHLTESRNVQREIQEKKRIVNEQISIFKSISTIFYIAIGASFLCIVYILCFINTPNLSGLKTHQSSSIHPKQDIASIKTIEDNTILQNLALEIEENETCLLKDPHISQEKLLSNGRAIYASPPHVSYKGYYFDASTKTAIIEVANSTTQLFIKEKQKFYSGTALLIKITKEEIIWKWQGNLYVTKIG